MHDCVLSTTGQCCERPVTHPLRSPTHYYVQVDLQQSSKRALACRSALTAVVKPGYFYANGDQTNFSQPCSSAAQKHWSETVYNLLYNVAAKQLPAEATGHDIHLKMGLILKGTVLNAKLRRVFKKSPPTNLLERLIEKEIETLN